MSADQLRRHARRLDEIDALLQRIAKDVEDLASLRQPPGGGLDAGSASNSEAGPSDPVFPSADRWVADYLLEVFQRSYGGELRWCAQWQDHPEATLRLEAMWRAWEVLQAQEGLGLSVWLLSHFDPNFLMLTSRTGPFARCTPDRHSA